MNDVLPNIDCRLFHQAVTFKEVGPRRQGPPCVEYIGILYRNQPYQEKNLGSVYYAHCNLKRYRNYPMMALF